MKRVLFLLIFCPSVLYGQLNQYKGLVKDFYELLYQKCPDTLAFKRIYPRCSDFSNVSSFIELCKSKKVYSDTIGVLRLSAVDGSQYTCFSAITQGKSLQDIGEIIDHASLYDDNNPFRVSLDLQFPDKKTIHFDLSTDTPFRIYDIWLNNGDNLNGLLIPANYEKLFRVALLNDLYGFSYVRARPDKKSRIVVKLNSKEIFYYIPVGGVNWVPVAMDDTPYNKFIGYIHKRRILNFKDFPKWLKEKMIKQYLNSGNFKSSVLDSASLQQSYLAWQNIQ